MVADDKVRGVYRDLVLNARALLPGLLPHDPHACPHAGAHLGRLLGNDELQARHGAETALEGLTGLDERIHGGIVEGLIGHDGVVGGLLEEWGAREVVEDGVGVNAAHLGDNLRGAPLDLVERRFVGGHGRGRARWGGARDEGF